MYEKRHYFNNTINNVSVNDFRNLDFKTTTLEDRKEIINNILKNDNDFFAVYFDEYYKTNISTTDELSEKNTICKLLEGFANYLLGSEEVREDRKKSLTQYRFYVDETEFKLRTKRELPLTNLTHKSEATEIESIDNVIHFLKQNKENFKKEKIISIKNSDLEKDNYCSKVLSEYNVLHEFLTEEIRNPNKIKGKRQKLTKMKKDVMDDMLYTKEHLKGIFGQNPRNLLTDSTCPNWDKLDYTNVLHMKKLLYIMNEFHPENELSFYLMDLEALYKETKKRGLFSEKEIRTYEMLRQGYKNVEIANKLNVYKNAITRAVNSLSRKMCSVAVELHWDEDVD